MQTKAAVSRQQLGEAGLEGTVDDGQIRPAALLGRLSRGRHTNTGRSWRLIGNHFPAPIPIIHRDRNGSKARRDGRMAATPNPTIIPI
jgi:hypothetical protein